MNLIYKILLAIIGSFAFYIATQNGDLSLLLIVLILYSEIKEYIQSRPKKTK